MVKASRTQIISQKIVWLTRFLAILYLFYTQNLVSKKIVQLDNSSNYQKQWEVQIGKEKWVSMQQPGGTEGGGGAETGGTEAISIFTGLWPDAKLVIPGRLKAARASIKSSEIRTRKWGFFTLSTGGSAARGLRFPYKENYEEIISMGSFRKQLWNSSI